MAGMSAYGGPVHGGPGTMASSKAGMPYSVNGVSLTSSSVDMLHPAMSGYQSKYNIYIIHFLVIICASRAQQVNNQRPKNLDFSMQ
jgi:hypothetical protein